MANKASIAQNAFVGLSSLIKLLPTGTVFAYQFLNPLLIGGDGESCKVANKVLSYILIVVCGLSCFFSSFTDSYTDSDGEVRYGIATFKGFWPNPDDKDPSSYKIRFGDFVHASFALLVFAGVALLNDNSVDCFYPSFEKHKKVVVSVLPTVVGAVSSAVFALFPTKRNYIGYPPSSQKSNPPSLYWMDKYAKDSYTRQRKYMHYQYI